MGNLKRHLLNYFQPPPPATPAVSSQLFLDSNSLSSLRHHSERLITLCATDDSFMSLPPSMVASASIASAVQQDYESGHMGLDVKEIVHKIQEVAKIEMVSCRVYCFFLCHWKIVLAFLHWPDIQVRGSMKRGWKVKLLVRGDSFLCSYACISVSSQL